MTDSEPAASPPSSTAATDAVERRPLGRTGLQVSAIGFGTSSLASLPATYGHEVSAGQAQETLDAIFTSEVNLLDTSRNYGLGRAEERIGAAFAAAGGKPEHLILSTKVDRDMDTLRFDAPQVRQSFEESLEALGVDRVDILHLHDPEHARELGEITATGGAIDELFRIRDEGLADALGLAMGRIDIMFPLLRQYPFDVALNHNRWTLLNRAADDMFDFCHKQGVGIINAAPYAGGVLAKGSDTVQRITYQEATDEKLEPVRAIESVCRDHGVPVGAVALQFSLRDPRIATTVLGVSKPTRVAQSLEWASMEIPDELWAVIDTLPFTTRDPEADRVWSGD